jgi:putative transferase (TIGR04331 family)
MNLNNSKEEDKVTDEEFNAFYELVEKKVEYLILKFVQDLNAYHGINKDVLWWRTVLIEWTKSFVIIYQYRLYLKNKKKILFNNDNVNSNVNCVEFVPLNYEDSSKIFHQKNSTWSKLIDSYINLNLKFSLEFSLNKIDYPNICQKTKIKTENFIYDAVLFIVRKYAKSTIFVHALYLNKVSQLTLLLSKRIIDYAHISPEIKLNQKLKLDLIFREPKQEILNDCNDNERLYLIAKKFIPRSYLEDFDSYIKYGVRHWPKNPQRIITANSHLANDAFKIYIAENRKVSEIIIIQHGSDYGTSEIFLTEKFEIEISDTFYTWGWKNSHSKVKELGIIKNFGSNFKKKRFKNGLLIIEHGFIYENSNIRGFEMENNYEIYKRFSIEFLNNLNSEIKSQTKVRSLNYKNLKMDTDSHIYPKSVFISELNDSKFSNRKKSILNESSRANLTVCMTNSTPFLEILNSGYPVVGLWPKDFESIRQEAREDFYNLKQLGIVFNDSNELARFINLNFSHINDWWTEIEHDERLKKFIFKYCRDISKSRFNKIFK